MRLRLLHVWSSAKASFGYVSVYGYILQELSSHGGITNLSMMFEDRKGYAIAESRARDAVAKLDPLLVAAERDV